MIAGRPSRRALHARLPDRRLVGLSALFFLAVCSAAALFVLLALALAGTASGAGPSRASDVIEHAPQIPGAIGRGHAAPSCARSAAPAHAPPRSNTSGARKSIAA